MTVRAHYYLYCTSCNKQYSEPSDESVDEVRSFASTDGWKYTRVENGSMWDFCPRCYKEYKKEPLK